MSPTPEAEVALPTSPAWPPNNEAAVSGWVQQVTGGAGVGGACFSAGWLSPQLSLSWRPSQPCPQTPAVCGCGLSGAQGRGVWCLGEACPAGANQGLGEQEGVSCGVAHPLVWGDRSGEAGLPSVS